MNKKEYTLIEQNIWKHNSGKKYLVDIYLGRDEQGKQQRTTKTYYSLADSRRALAIIKADRIKGIAKTKTKAPTIFELMKDYREVYIERKTEKTTSYGYSVIEKHIKTFFDETNINTRVDKITATTIDKYYSYLLNMRTKRLPNGMSANSIIKHYNYLSQLFDYAVKHNDVYGINVNPVKKSTPPKKQKKQSDDYLSKWNVDVINDMLSVLDKTNDIAFKSAVLIGLFLGARRGEMEYLKWSDIDFETGTIKISGCRTSTNEEIIKDTTKSGYSRETSMSEMLINTLREYKEWQLHNKEIFGEEYFDSDYVVVKANGKPYSVKWINGKFTKFLDENGFPHLRYHDLRHLNASILLCVMPIADVSKHLGHTTVNTTTRIYAHSLMKEKNAVALGLNKVFCTN